MRISDWSSDVCSSDLFAAFEKIEHPAGRGDQDVDAAVQLTDLVVEALAADQEGVVQLLVFTVELEILSDLRRQLAGGLQDQRSWHARPRPAVGQELDQRKREGRRLASSVLADAQAGASLQNERTIVAL